VAESPECPNTEKNTFKKPREVMAVRQVGKQAGILIILLPLSQKISQQCDAPENRSEAPSPLTDILNERENKTNKCACYLSANFQQFQGDQFLVRKCGDDLLSIRLY